MPQADSNPKLPLPPLPKLVISDETERRAPGIKKSASDFNAALDAWHKKAAKMLGLPIQ